MMLCLLVFVVAAGIESDAELKQGQELMEAFDYERATEVFQSVAKRPGISDPDRAVALVWLGLAAAELRDQARASLAFEDAILADPLIVLPRDASPKIKALLEDARGRVRLRPKAVARAADPVVPSPTEAGAPAPGGGGDEGGERAGGGLAPIAIGTLAVGGVVALAGAAVWGVGLALRQQAVDEPFQSKAAELAEQSVAAQIGGQVTTAVGVLALVIGGALLAVGAME